MTKKNLATRAAMQSIRRTTKANIPGASPKQTFFTDVLQVCYGFLGVVGLIFYVFAVAAAWISIGVAFAIPYCFLVVYTFNHLQLTGFWYEAAQIAAGIIGVFGVVGTYILYSVVSEFVRDKVQARCERNRRQSNSNK